MRIPFYSFLPSAASALPHLVRSACRLLGCIAFFCLVALSFDLSVFWWFEFLPRWIQGGEHASPTGLHGFVARLGAGSRGRASAVPSFIRGGIFFSCRFLRLLDEDSFFVVCVYPRDLFSSGSCLGIVRCILC